MGDLSGRVALVTGGGRGIGRAVAAALSGAGAAVAVAGRGAAALDEARASLAGPSLAVRCDVSDSGEVARMVAEVEARLGPVDILVNNAGVTASARLTEVDDATWDRILRVNATGPFYCCRAVIPGMQARGWGRIVNVASIAGLSGLAYSAAYSASKHALVGLTRSLAIELGRSGVTANALCPGWVATDMLADAVATIVARTGRTPEQALASILALSQQQRPVAPEEVAAQALRLAGPEGDGVTGQAIPIL